MTGQYVDIKQRGGQVQERSMSRDTNSGRPRRNRDICRHAAHFCLLGLSVGPGPLVENHCSSVRANVKYLNASVRLLWTDVVEAVESERLVRLPMPGHFLWGSVMKTHAHTLAERNPQV